MQNLLEIKHLNKEYENKPLLQDISLILNSGETICLLGASGSGKSTLLRMIAGIEQPDSGEILWNGKDILNTPAHLRNFGLMFQSYALFPHLNVWQNVAFGLRSRHLTHDQISSRVGEVLDTVNMRSFGQRKVTDLSGGEQQRVALARTLAIQPRLLMLDEPLAALDRSLRQDLLAELREILHITLIPTIYVTHDQEEAYSIADKLVLLIDGRIQQEGTPQEVYNTPENVEVAKFLGLNNTIRGKILTIGKTVTVLTSLGEFIIPASSHHGLNLSDNVTLVFRKAILEHKDQNMLEVKIVDVVFREDGYFTKVTANGIVFTFLLDTLSTVGEQVKLHVPVESILSYPWNSE